MPAETSVPGRLPRAHQHTKMAGSPNWATKSRVSSVRRLFTEYVRSFGDGSTQPDEDSLRQVLSALRSVLVSELRRRGLWTCPPSYLGIHEGNAWYEAQRDGESWHQGALDELLSECYIFVFVSRFSSMRRQLQVKDNIDGLVLLNVRNFVFERQKKFDPLGYRVFGILRSAIRESVEAGELLILEGDSSIRNDTVLGLDPEARTRPQSPDAFESIARRWNDALMPDMISAWGKGQRKVVTELCRRFGEIGDLGVRAFTFKQLVDPLKRDARARWASILSQEFDAMEGGAETGRPSPRTPPAEPDPDFIERDSFAKLAKTAYAVLGEYQAPPPTKRQLSSLLEYLINYSIAGEDDSPGGTIPIARSKAGGNSMPSNRQIAAALGISRNRLPQLFEILGRLIQDAQSRQSAEGDVISIGESRPKPDAQGKDTS